MENGISVILPVVISRASARSLALRTRIAARSNRAGVLAAVRAQRARVRYQKTT